MRFQNLVPVFADANARGSLDRHPGLGFTMLWFPFVVVVIYVNWSIPRCRDAEGYGMQATSVGESTAFMSAGKAPGLFFRTPEATSCE